MLTPKKDFNAKVRIQELNNLSHEKNAYSKINYQTWNNKLATFESSVASAKKEKQS